MCSRDSQCCVPAWPHWCLSLLVLYSCRLPVTLLPSLSAEGQKWNVAFVPLSLSNWNTSVSTIQFELKVKASNVHLVLVLFETTWKKNKQTGCSAHFQRLKQCFILPVLKYMDLVHEKYQNPSPRRPRLAPATWWEPPRAQEKGWQNRWIEGWMGHIVVLLKQQIARIGADGYPSHQLVSQVD